MTASERRIIAKAIERLKGRGFDEAVAMLQKLQRRRPSSDKKKLAKQNKKQRARSARDSRNEATRAIREACVHRARGHCEFCGGMLDLQMHHLEGGSGRRRQRQAVSNCIMLCWMCHGEYHNYPNDCQWRVEAWCKEYGYPLPARFRSGPRPQVAPKTLSSAKDLK